MGLFKGIKKVLKKGKKLAKKSGKVAKKTGKAIGRQIAANNEYNDRPMIKTKGPTKD